MYSCMQLPGLNTKKCLLISQPVCCRFGSWFTVSYFVGSKAVKDYETECGKNEQLLDRLESLK